MQNILSWKQLDDQFLRQKVHFLLFVNKVIKILEIDDKGETFKCKQLIQ